MGELQASEISDPPCCLPSSNGTIAKDLVWPPGTLSDCGQASCHTRELGEDPEISTGWGGDNDDPLRICGDGQRLRKSVPYLHLFVFAKGERLIVRHASSSGPGSRYITDPVEFVELVEPTRSSAIPNTLAPTFTSSTASVTVFEGDRPESKPLLSQPVLHRNRRTRHWKCYEVDFASWIGGGSNTMPKSCHLSREGDGFSNDRQ